VYILALLRIHCRSSRCIVLQRLYTLKIHVFTVLRPRSCRASDVRIISLIKNNCRYVLRRGIRSKALPTARVGRRDANRYLHGAGGVSAIVLRARVCVCVCVCGRNVVFFVHENVIESIALYGLLAAAYAAGDVSAAIAVRSIDPRDDVS